MINNVLFTMTPLISNKEKAATGLAAIPLIKSRPMTSSTQGSQIKAALAKISDKNLGKGVKNMVKASGWWSSLPTPAVIKISPRVMPALTPIWCL
jgi:hypothetical protein